MDKRTLVGVLGVVLIGAVYVVLNSTSSEVTAKRTHIVRSNRDVSAENESEIASRWTQNGVFLTKEQCIRLNRLGTKAIRTGALPSSDIDFLVATIQDPQTASTSPSFIHFQAGYDLAKVKSFTTDQKNRVLAACLPLLKSQAPLDQRCALAGATIAESPAAIPVAQLLLKSDTDANRKSAQTYLARFGGQKVD